MNVTLVNLGFPDYPVALANALARRVNLTFVQAARLTDPWQAQIDPNIHLMVRGLPRIRDPRSLAAVFALLRTLCNLKPDILHLQDSVNPWFDLIAASHDLPPLVVTVHDATRHPGENRGEWFTGYLRKRLLLRAQVVIVHASIQRDLLCSTWEFRATAFILCNMEKWVLCTGERRQGRLGKLSNEIPNRFCSSGECSHIRVSASSSTR